MTWVLLLYTKGWVSKFSSMDETDFELFPRTDRLTASIKYVVDTLGRSTVRGEESTIDQTPEIEHATDDVWISTHINAACGRVPFVSRGLQRLAEGHVGMDLAGRVVCCTRIYVIGVSISRDAENDLVKRESGAGPSLDSRHRRTCGRWCARVV
jgi:hypothetical protein